MTGPKFVKSVVLVFRSIGQQFGRIVQPPLGRAGLDNETCPQGPWAINQPDADANETEFRPTGQEG